MVKVYPDRATGQFPQASWFNGPQKDIKVLTSQVFNVREDTFAGGAKGDGSADDTTQIQAAIDACGAAGGGTVLFPTGTYRLNAQTIVGSIGWYLAIDKNNVALQGQPGAILDGTVASTTNTCIVRAHGAFKPGGRSAWNSNKLLDATFYTINPAAKAALSVTTATAANAGNFAADDWVFIRTGQVLSTGTTNPDSEINRVVSADAGTGIITLQYPLAKPYAQEYFISGTAGYTGTAVTANLAVLGIAKVTDRIVENSAIRGLTIRNLVASGGALLVHGEAVGVEVSDCELITNHAVHGGGIHRDFKMLRNRIRMKSPADRYWVSPSTGCTTIEIAHNRVTADANGYLHVHEGVAQLNAHHNVMLLGSGGTNNYVEVKLRAYDIHILDNVINSTGTRPPISVDETCNGGGVIQGNNCNVGSGSFGITCSASNWLIEGNKPIELRVNQLAVAGTTVYGDVYFPQGAAPLQHYISSAFVADDMQNPTVIKLPEYCVVDKVNIDVTQAFDSSGTDTISIGTDADNVKFGTATDVSTTGLKTVTAGTGLGRYQATAQTVEAYYVNGGTEPTVGRALVEVYWHKTAREVA